MVSELIPSICSNAAILIALFWLSKSKARANNDLYLEEEEEEEDGPQSSYTSGIVMALVALPIMGIATLWYHMFHSDLGYTGSVGLLDLAVLQAIWASGTYALYRSILGSPVSVNFSTSELLWPIYSLIASIFALTYYLMLIPKIDRRGIEVPAGFIIGRQGLTALASLLLVWPFVDAQIIKRKGRVTFKASFYNSLAVLGGVMAISALFSQFSPFQSVITFSKSRNTAWFGRNITGIFYCVCYSCVALLGWSTVLQTLVIYDQQSPMESHATPHNTTYPVKTFGSSFANSMSILAGATMAAVVLYPGLDNAMIWYLAGTAAMGLYLGITISRSTSCDTLWSFEQICDKTAFDSTLHKFRSDDEKKSLLS